MLVQSEELKRSVRDYWNADPCGTWTSEADFGTRAFFDEVERYRYGIEPHIAEIAQFDKWQGKRVLEIGCGLGTDLTQFARGGARTVGLDLTPRAAEIGRDRFAVYGLEGDFTNADAENLPFVDES